MRYEEVVKQAAGALKLGEDASWELARLTYEATNNRGGNHSGGGVTLKQWAEDVHRASGRRFSETTAGRYRRCWVNHGRNVAGDVLIPFMDAYAEVDGTPDRGRMMEYEGKRLLEEGTPEQKIEQAEALLSDPAVEAAAMNPLTPLGQRTFALRGMREREVEREAEERDRETEQRDNADPVIRRLSQMQAIQDLTGVYADAAAQATALLRQIVALPRIGDDPLADRVFLTEAIERLRATIKATEDLLAGRAQGVDAFFAQVLKEAKG